MVYANHENIFTMKFPDLWYLATGLLLYSKPHESTVLLMAMALLYNTNHHLSGGFVWCSLMPTCMIGSPSGQFNRERQGVLGDK